MFALKPNAKPHGTFGARDLTTLTLKDKKKQKGFVSSCYGYLALLYCHCELALKGSRRFPALTAFFKIRIKPFPS